MKTYHIWLSPGARVVEAEIEAESPQQAIDIYLNDLGQAYQAIGHQIHATEKEF